MVVQLRSEDLDKLRTVLKNFPLVQKAVIFGSRALGIARRDSDIDLAISAHGITDSDWAELQESLEKTPIVYPMDIIRFDQLPQNEFRKKIESQGIQIYPK